MGAWRGLMVVLLLSCGLIEATTPCQELLLNNRPPFWATATPISLHARIFWISDPHFVSDEKKKNSAATPKSLHAGQFLNQPPPVWTKEKLRQLKSSTTPKTLHARSFWISNPHERPPEKKEKRTFWSNDPQTKSNKVAFPHSAASPQ